MLDETVDRQTRIACGRHLDGIVVRLTADVGTPTVTPYNPTRADQPPPDAQLDLFGGAT